MIETVHPGRERMAGEDGPSSAAGLACADVDTDFDTYVQVHRATLVRYASLLSGSRAEAEDLVQDVLVRLYPRWSDLSDPHPYVRRCVTNEFLSWRRRWSTRHIQVAPDAVLDSQLVDPWVDSGADPELWALLHRLPRQQRAAVVLRYWEGLDDTEIGELLECKPASVRSHVSRGLASLRETLQPADGREGVAGDER